MWRSIGFLMSFAVVLDGMTLITYLIILGGGKQKRESGWKLLTLFLLMVGLVQCAAMGLVVSFDSSLGWIQTLRNRMLTKLLVLLVRS